MIAAAPALCRTLLPIAALVLAASLYAPDAHAAKRKSKAA